jgi:hypothetical protein
MGCEYFLSEDYSKEEIRAFRRLYPIINNNTLQDILSKHSKWLLDYDPLNPKNWVHGYDPFKLTNLQDNPHNIKCAVWHVLTHPDKNVQPLVF